MTYTFGNGFVVPTEVSEPVKTPQGILVTRSVETKAGWVGQIVVDKAIIWESAPVPGARELTKDPDREAVKAANKRVYERLRGLFADAAPPDQTGP